MSKKENVFTKNWWEKIIKEQSGSTYHISASIRGLFDPMYGAHNQVVDDNIVNVLHKHIYKSSTVWHL